MTTQKTDFNERVLEEFDRKYKTILQDFGLVNTFNFIRLHIISILSQVRADEKEKYDKILNSGKQMFEEGKKVGVEEFCKKWGIIKK
jgi:hypothetical protein